MQIFTYTCSLTKCIHTTSKFSKNKETGISPKFVRFQLTSFDIFVAPFNQFHCCLKPSFPMQIKILSSPVGSLMPYPWHCLSCVVCVHHNYQK